MRNYEFTQDVQLGVDSAEEQEDGSFWRAFERLRRVGELEGARPCPRHIMNNAALTFHASNELRPREYGHTHISITQGYSRPLDMYFNDSGVTSRHR